MIIFIIPKNSGLEKCREIITLEGLNGRLIEVRGEDVALIVSQLISKNKKVIGITGEDLFKEFLLENKNTGVKILKRVIWEDPSFIFKKPTLCLLGPQNTSLEELPKNLKIGINRKYKELAKKYCTNLLEGKGYCLEKIYASGATEELFYSKIVDLVIDIVCSGKSAEKYGLKFYDKLFSSDIVILGGKNDSI